MAAAGCPLCSHPTCRCSGGGGRYSRGAPAALGVRAGPARTGGESQELKEEGLPPPSLAPLLCQLLKFSPPQTQPQHSLVAKYSITQFPHQCIPSTAMGLLLAIPCWLQEGKVGAQSSCPRAAPSLTLTPGPPMGPGSPLAPVKPCKRDSRKLLPALLLSGQMLLLQLFPS